MNNNTSMQKAFIAWQQCAALRGRRLRMKRYTFGDQWGDIVTVEGEGNMTEREQRVRKGENPVTNNIIRQLVKTVVGCYRASRKASGGNTDIIETDARTFEEYLISGCAIQRVISERNGERMARMFAERWVPLEEKYFKAFDTRGSADIVLRTDL